MEMGMCGDSACAHLPTDRMPRGMAAMPMTFDDRKQSLRISTKDTKLIGSMTVGDEVTLMVKGKVMGVEAPEKHSFEGPNGKKKNDVFPGMVKLEVSRIENSSKSPDGMREVNDMLMDEEG